MIKPGTKYEDAPVAAQLAHGPNGEIPWNCCDVIHRLLGGVGRRGQPRVKFRCFGPGAVVPGFHSRGAVFWDPDPDIVYIFPGAPKVPAGPW